MAPARPDSTTPQAASPGDAATPGASNADAEPLASDLHILRLLRQIIQAVNIHSRKLRTEYAITAPQLVTLLCIIERGPLTATQIARAVHLSSSTVVGILDRLETRGFVQRERSADDRRQVLVTATERGRDLGRRTPSPLQDKLAAALRSLPEAERSAIERSLRRVVDLMGAEDIEAAPVLESGSIDRPE